MADTRATSTASAERRLVIDRMARQAGLGIAPHDNDARIAQAQQRHAERPDSNRSEQPAYAYSELRSIRPEFLVLVGIYTHLGCVPLFRPAVVPADLGASWAGGFYCPCYGSKFDLAGRIFKNVPAPVNLVVPPHHFVTDTALIISSDKPTA